LEPLKSYIGSGRTFFHPDCKPSAPESDRNLRIDLSARGLAGQKAALPPVGESHPNVNMPPFKPVCLHKKAPQTKTAGQQYAKCTLASFIRTVPSALEYNQNLRKTARGLVGIRRFTAGGEFHPAPKTTNIAYILPLKIPYVNNMRPVFTICTKLYCLHKNIVII
jgi:hypothetical protein